jgi:hypothetical protein
LDTQAGTGGMLPHISQVNWNFIDGASRVIADGIAYRIGRGDPDGERNNCLIDSIRQCLGLQVDCRKVRSDLQCMYAAAQGRRKVTETSYLDITEHWEAILESLFKHNTAGANRRRTSISDYCVIGLYNNSDGNADNGVVAGNVKARYRLVVLNNADVHFDPCLPLENAESHK